MLAAENWLYLLNGGFEQQSGLKVGEVPAVRGLGTVLPAWGVDREADHSPFVLHLIHHSCHILTHFQFWETKKIIQLKMLDRQSSWFTINLSLNIWSHLPGCAVVPLVWAGRLWSPWCQCQWCSHDPPHCRHTHSTPTVLQKCEAIEVKE